MPRSWRNKLHDQAKALTIDCLVRNDQSWNIKWLTSLSNLEKCSLKKGGRTEANTKDAHEDDQSF